MNTNDHPGTCDCREILQLVLDGQATAEEQQRLREHLQQCPECHHHYQLDATLVQMLKQNCCGGPEPNDLLGKVKAQLNFNN